jgi:hypothetical protein
MQPYLPPVKVALRGLRTAAKWLRMNRTDSMRAKSYFPKPRDEGKVIAYFGEARLIKYLNGKYKLLGSSELKLTEAKKWLDLFCPEAVVRGQKNVRNSRRGYA